MYYSINNSDVERHQLERVSDVDDDEMFEVTNPIDM